MRLRTKLALAFAAVAALPILALLPPTRHAMARVYEDALSERLDSASHAAALTLQNAADDADRAAAELAASEPLADLAQSARDGSMEPASVVALGEKLMTLRGVDVLEVMDEHGKVLTSGHLPARAGDPDPAGLALATNGGPPRPLIVEVRTDQGIEKALAVVAARATDVGPGHLFVLAGRRLGAPFARRLAELTGTEVEVTAVGLPSVQAGPQLAADRSRARVLTIPPESPPDEAAGHLTLRLSAQGLAQGEDELLRSALLLAGIALALAAVVGVGLALRITRPVDALAVGAAALAKGDLAYRVETDAVGEIGDLVRTFNAMATDLKSATDRAAAAERIAAWEEVARRLAHEIKNPLTPIRMSVETLQQAYAKQHPRFAELFLEGTGAVIEEVDRLKRIVDEFSRFARLPRPQLVAVDLAELIGQALPLYASSQVELRRELEDGLPAVHADRDQLTQVIVNLLTNAEQAMPQGGICTVRLRRGTAREVVLEIEDRGPGIPEADRQRIFEPYFTTKAGGSGLGLAIVQRIVTEHGGRIEVGGQPGEGACFRVILVAIA